MKIRQDRSLQNKNLRGHEMFFLIVEKDIHELHSELQSGK
jgi:hypothetical protein